MFRRISIISFFIILLILLSFQQSSTQIQVQDVKDQQMIRTQDESKNLKVNLDYERLPLYFIPNEGQLSKEALFYAKASKYTLWLTKEGLVFDSIRHRGLEDSKSHQSPASNPTIYDRNVSRLIFLNANNNPKVIPVNTTEHRVNYFIGNDESKWRTDVHTSRAVLYKELYKHIDLKVYGIEKQIEYDFIVKPGGEASDIRFEYKPAKGTKIDEEGNLVIETEFGELRHAKPMSYQVIGGRKLKVEAQFKKIKKNTYGFEVEKYDKDYELIIDPLILVYSTYLGGSTFDYPEDIAVDSKGAVYVVGWTWSSDFPTKKALYGTFAGGVDVFIVKINPKGKRLIYSTYLGGYDDDSGFGIAVDKKGAAYVTGRTLSSDFPTKKAIYGAITGYFDAFIAKIDPEGKSLTYSTYLGGSFEDIGKGIAVDKKGAAYVTGHTLSSDFPTKKAIYGAIAENMDCFITKIDSSGGALVYSTYLGGYGEDYGIGIAVDRKKAAYVTGWTNSLEFPTKNPVYGTIAGDKDCFITKISSSGGALVYSTYLGGSGEDYGNGIAVDRKKAAYVTGWTNSLDFPAKNPVYGTIAGDKDCFITKISSSGGALVYSTYLGGSSEDYGNGIAVDRKKAAYVTGYTLSSDFPTKNPIQESWAGGRDAFATKISPEGKGLIYSTYLGGSGEEYGVSIAVDKKGATYMTGYTYSYDFPLKKAIQKSNAGPSDAFITKLKY